MTPQQKATLKAAILADPATYPLDNYDTIANALNATATPAFIVWKSSLPFADVMDNMIDVDWQQMDNLSTGQARIWENLQFVGSIKPSSTAHRAAITECWKGTAAKVAVKDRIIALGKRSATRAEKLLATGTGSDASPATMGFEGSINLFEIGDILS